jgi:hypothetical protein
VRGVEYGGAVNLLQKNVKVEAKVFVPEGVRRIRGAWVVVAYALGGNTACCFYDESWRRFAESMSLALVHARFSTISADPQVTVWRNAELGGSDALLAVFENIASETQRAELRGMPLLFWGHSQGGPFGSTFAALHPERTIAVIRYHSGPVGLEHQEASRIPKLVLMGGRDSVVEPVRSQVSDLWHAGRRKSAPWTFAMEPLAEHGSLSDVQKANMLLFPWIAAVMNQRVSATGTVRDVADRNGWLGNLVDHSIAGFETARFPQSEANWLPDEASAKAWHAVVTAPN